MRRRVEKTNAVGTVRKSFITISQNIEYGALVWDLSECAPTHHTPTRRTEDGQIEYSRTEALRTTTNIITNKVNFMT